jgi:hypothetical protein
MIQTFPPGCRYALGGAPSRASPSTRTTPVHPSPPATGSGYRGGMAREIRIEIDDEQYEQLKREAHQRHEDPDVYAGRVLADGLNKARFLQGCAEFLATPGMREEFASRFGPQPGPSATAA